MHREKISKDDLASYVANGFFQSFKADPLLELAERQGDKSVVLLGIHHACFWLYPVYAHLKHSHPEKVDRIMLNIIDKVVPILNKSGGGTRFLNLITLEPKVLTLYLYTRWVSQIPKVRDWMNNNHKLMQLNAFENEDWHGQLLLLFCSNISLVIFSNKERVDNIYEWTPVYRSCLATVVAFSNIMSSQLKEHELEVK